MGFTIIIQEKIDALKLEADLKNNKEAKKLLRKLNRQLRVAKRLDKYILRRVI